MPQVELIEPYALPKPRIPLKKILSMIAWRIIFPPILLWDFVKWGFNRWLGRFAGKLVLQAQGRPAKSDRERQNMFDNILRQDVTVKEVSVSFYNAALDTIEIHSAAKDGAQAQNEKYIIRFPGNGEFYEDTYQSLVDTAKEHQCHVIGFNYRGVGHSTGAPRSKDDLVADGIAQVQRLLDKSVNPDYITLQGHSLGSGIATLVAKHFYDHNIKINLFNGSSFSSLTNVVAGWISVSGGEVRTGHRESTGKKILAAIAWPFIRFGLALVNWEMNAASAYKALPNEYKEYMVVRSAKADRSDSVLDDNVITHYGSLHMGIKDVRKKEKAKIDAAIKTIDEIGTHQVVAEEAKRARDALTEARLRLKQRKMVVNNPDYSATFGGHNLPHTELSDRHRGNTAVTFFNEFVRRTEAHHQQAASKPSRKI